MKFWRMINMKKNLSRLFRILKGKKYLLVISIILIIIIQGLNFISPLIVKRILDDCILGIEYNWVEVHTLTSYTGDKYVWLPVIYAGAE